MKIRLCFLFACLFSFWHINAQSINTEVETSIANLNAAMISKDKSTLEKLTAEELSFGHSTGVVENKTEFIQNVLSGPTTFYKIDISNQSINPADNIAIVRNTSTISGSTKGQPLDIKIGVLMIWKKDKGVWKLVARQGFKLPEVK
ncbi:MAG TPA: nuclear transport factor 2 family protein [Puia sp.]|nr:nuclear transport factor 2 family protein [Puia sp.]